MRGHREAPQNLRGTFLPKSRNSRNSFQITSLADHHTLTPIESHPYEKTWGAGAPSSEARASFAFCFAKTPLYFQSVAGCSSRNSFLFKLLHCCRGVAWVPRWRSESIT